MEGIKDQKREEALKRLVKDLVEKSNSDWYGEIILTVRKGIVETASFRDSKKYI